MSRGFPNLKSVRLAVCLRRRPRPRYHHWHHARQAEYIDANYAIHLPLVDMLMGTFKRPPRGQWPSEYGVMKLETVPRGFWAQARMPLSGRKAWDDYVGRDAVD